MRQYVYLVSSTPPPHPMCSRLSLTPVSNQSTCSSRRIDDMTPRPLRQLALPCVSHEIQHWTVGMRGSTFHSSVWGRGERVPIELEFTTKCFFESIDCLEHLPVSFAFHVFVCSPDAPLIPGHIEPVLVELLFWSRDVRCGILIGLPHPIRNIA